MPKIQLNAKAPDFSLPDFNGQTVSLSAFRGNKHVVIIFNRGFSWPYCRRHLAQLRQDHQKFIDLDAAILIAGPENAVDFKQYWAEENWPFIGLPDPTHSILKLYGQEVNLFKLGRMPAQVIVDKQGVARYAHYGHSMRDIPENSDLLNIFSELNSIKKEWVDGDFRTKAATKISAQKSQA